MRWLVATVLCLAPGAAWSQACCTATGAGEFGVVGRCHTGTFTAMLSYERALGSYDAEGEYQRLDGASVDDVVMAVGGGWRVLSRRFQVHGSVPVRVQRRALNGLSSATSSGLGDLTLGARYTALMDPMLGLAKSALPFLDLYVVGRLPTGRAPHEGEAPSGADIMGDGAYEAQVGVKLTKFVWPSDALVLSGAVGHRFAHQVGDREVEPGSAISARAGWIHLHNIFWSGGVDANLRLTGERREDGRRLSDSETRRLRFGAHVTRVLVLPTWEMSGAVQFDPWWTDGGANQPFVGPTVSLSLQRSFL